MLIKDNGLRGLWRRFSLWYQNSPFLGPLIFSWLSLTWISLLIPFDSLLNFVILFAIGFTNIHFMHKLTSAEVKQLMEDVKKDFGKSEEYKQISEAFKEIREQALREKEEKEKNKDEE